MCICGWFPKFHTHFLITRNWSPLQYKQRQPHESRGNHGGTWDGKMEAEGVRGGTSEPGLWWKRRERGRETTFREKKHSVESWRRRTSLVKSGGKGYPTHTAPSTKPHGASVNLHMIWHDWKTKHTVAFIPVCTLLVLPGLCWDLHSWGLRPRCSKGEGDPSQLTQLCEDGEPALPRWQILRGLEPGSSCA